MKVSEALVVEIITNEQFRKEVEKAFLDRANFTITLPSELTSVPVPVTSGTLKQHFTAKDLQEFGIEVYAFGSQHDSDGREISPYRRNDYSAAVIEAVNDRGHVSWGNQTTWYSDFHPRYFGNPNYWEVFHGIIDASNQYCSIQDCLNDNWSWSVITHEHIGRHTSEFPGHFFRKAR